MLKALEVSQSVGVRVLLIHAKDDEAKSFYSHYGFVESPIDPLVMMMFLYSYNWRPNLRVGTLTAANV